MATLSTQRKKSDRVKALGREVGVLKKRLARLEQTRPLLVPIESLAPDPYEVIKPFHVVVQRCEDEFVATFFDANVSASGETEADAVRNLKDIIVAVFESLVRADVSHLGPIPLQQLRVMTKHIRKTA